MDVRTRDRTEVDGAVAEARRRADVADVVFVGLAVALFALSGRYVSGCERLIGSWQAGDPARQTTLREESAHGRR